MNLTDYEQTSIARAFEEVRYQAERFGVGIAGSEIVGLAPQAALDSAAEHFLQIENFRPEIIFENRLQSLLGQRQALSGLSVADFLDAVSQTKAVPGGGSVAALAGALAASLGEMVAGFSLSRKELAEHHARLQELMAKFKAAHVSLQIAIQKDSDSFAGVEAALKMPKATEEEKQRRQELMQRALRVASLVPIDVAEISAALLQYFRQMDPISNPNLKSDLQTGVHMAHAAIRGALANVAVNLASIKDEAFRTELRSRIEAVEKITAQQRPSDI